MVAGTTQVGRGMLLSCEISAKQVIVNVGNPNAANGHYVEVRRPSCRIDVFWWSGTAYAAPSDVFDALTTNGSGNYVLTDKWNNRWTFDVRGMPATYTDRQGNVDTYTYNASYQLTGYTDERGKSYTITQNGTGYIGSIADPAGRTWALGYGTGDNLTSITTPTTPDQTSGIATTLNYDGSNRLTSVVDGRGNTAFSVTYVGATSQVSTITIDGDTVSFSYAAGVTTRTDRNGNVHKTDFSGNQVTQTETIVSSLSKYVTIHRYSGVFPSNTVSPRGNRVDFTYSANGNLTERRHRTADTGTNHSSDLVHTWGTA